MHGVTVQLQWQILVFHCSASTPSSPSLPKLKLWSSHYWCCWEVWEVVHIPFELCKPCVGDSLKRTIKLLSSFWEIISLFIFVVPLFPVRTPLKGGRDCNLVNCLSGTFCLASSASPCSLCIQPWLCFLTFIFENKLGKKNSWIVSRLSFFFFCLVTVFPATIWAFSRVYLKVHALMLGFSTFSGKWAVVSIKQRTLGNTKVFLSAWKQEQTAQFGFLIYTARNSPGGSCRQVAMHGVKEPSCETVRGIQYLVQGVWCIELSFALILLIWSS